MRGTPKTPNFAELEHLLALTRRHINTPRFQLITEPLPDEMAAACLLNLGLHKFELELQYEEDLTSHWHLHATAADREAAPIRDALYGLARLVEIDGWTRVKRCQHPECAAQYIDQTNGNRRKYCDAHRVRITGPNTANSNIASSR